MVRTAVRGYNDDVEPSGTGSRFQFVGGRLALDFVNTVGDRLHAPTRRDYFASPHDLVRWVQASPLGALEPEFGGVSRDGVTRTIELRERLYRVCVAFADGSPPAVRDLDALARDLVRARERQRLVPDAGGLRWDWLRSASALDRILDRILFDALDLLTSPAAARVHRCADDRCGWLFLDLSPTGRRRWCSMADCGNRAKARRHYARGQRTASKRARRVPEAS
jgi:predicted RNA-binding Zn ribbon-like protein